MTLPRRTRLAIFAGVATLVAALSVAAAAASASTLYVAKNDPNCSNSGSGTATQPFCSITPAAARVAAGETVQVSAGTYNEMVTVSSSGTASAPIRFTAVPGDTVTVTGGTNGFSISSRSYVTVEGFNVTATPKDGIVVKNSTDITLRGNHVTKVGQPVSGSTAKGIRVDSSRDCLVVNNTVDHNTDYGIYLVGSRQNEVLSNVSFANARGFQRAASGFRIHSSSDNTISGNVSHDNEDSGIELNTGASNNVVVNNVLYNDGDHGLDDTGTSPNNSIIGNVVYKNTTAGINIEGSSTGATIENNVSVDNAINSPRTTGNIRVDTDSTMGATLDYNVVYMSNGGRNYVWSLGYNTLAEMQMASGQEVHSTQADPKWTSPSTGDFTLRSGSPAIDSANSGVAGAQSSDADGNSRIDDPSTANTGAGPRTYDDRGPYEYQPQDHPPLAKLNVSPSSGVVDLDVTADASASSDTDGSSPIASYRFEFGDGSAAVGPQSTATASHTYRRAGTFTVTVKVTDTAGLSSTATSTVTVKDDPPVAAIAATPSTGPAPLLVAVDASASTDTDATRIASYSFNWGDGSSTGPQSGPQASHTYAVAGSYTVTVTVQDSAGLTSQATTDVTAYGSNVPPTARLSVTPSSGDVDLAVTADASASTDPDDGISSYRFDWGDGSPATGPQSAADAAHTYRAAGDYTVTVTVTDAGGDASDATSQVTVTDSPPVARLTVSASSAVAPVAVTADGSASTDTDGTPIASYAFDWGDGSAATGPQASARATHTYATAGSYAVTMTVKDAAGQATTATTQVLARSNLVGNPGFETSLTGWNTSGSIAGVTVGRVAGGHGGDWSAKLVNGATTAGTCTLNDAPDWAKPTVAGNYAASIWVRADTPGATLKVRLTEWSGTANVGSAVATVTLSTSWQSVRLNYTTVAPGSSLDFNTYVLGAPPGTCFYADDVSIYLT
jgi:parallel beta-helix repeat protein